NMEYNSLYNLPVDNSIDDMMCDCEGNLWFSSSRQGVLKIAPSQFLDINMAAGIETGVVNTTCLYNDKLYIGTDKGLKVTDKDNNAVDDPLCGYFENVRIRCIKADKNDNLWFCTFGDKGLVCAKKDGTIKSFTTADGFLSNRFRTAEVLENGDIAVSCTGGVYILGENGIKQSYTNKDGIGNADILCIADSGDGMLYLGSDGDGIYRIKDSKIEHLGIENGLKSEVVLKIKKDDTNGLYWIITGNSIAYMKNWVITSVTNFPYSNNFDIYPDKNGRVWVLSSNGIYTASVSSILNGGEVDHQFYDTKSGLPCTATVNSSSAVDSDGRLYMAGSTGVVCLDLNDGDDSLENVRLAVPFVDADGVIYPVKNNSVTIPAGTRRLTIYDYVLTYSLKNPRVRYSLVGFDKNPCTLTKQDMEPVSYTNLKGGTYQFRLSVIDTFTRFESGVLNITVIKEKALYERLWFNALLAAGFLALLIFGVRRYLKLKTAKLIKKQNEQKQYIDEIIRAFALCIDMKDKYTKGHSTRVAKYSRMLAKKMGYTDEAADELYNIALLHDIGKISIPDNVLNKPGRATDEEYEILKSHAQNGYEILRMITIAPELADGARYHHERPDGKGYPQGIPDTEIPERGKIIAVADTFDAMYSNRPYRKKLELDFIVNELKRVSGTQLDPKIVECMLEIIASGEVGERHVEE
ncbi:MAG: HD domain-containing protein, partial [Firmicutes bacterium]|nr:HD domain-containing protein [Bacillota bacterium]